MATIANMHADYHLIGERIKEQRKHAGLTQERLAEKLGVSTGYVSQVERGITKISLDLLAAVSSALRCDMGLLVAGSATGGNEYLQSEYIEAFRQLSPKQKQLAMSFLQLLQEQTF